MMCGFFQLMAYASHADIRILAWCPSHVKFMHLSVVLHFAIRGV